MEKLLELVNYYEKEKEKSEGINVEKYVLFSWDKNYKGGLVRYYEVDPREGDNLQTKEAITYLISKSYGFIKWLVENDKIDRKKLERRPFSDELVYSDSDCTVYRSDTTYEMLLMLLSISDTPIEDLISYLK